MPREADYLEDDDRLLAFTVDIVTAHIANNSVPVGDVPDFITAVHSRLATLGAVQEDAPENQPAVPIMDPRKAVKPDYIHCLECGKKQKMLRQHLLAKHGLTAEQYREKFGLPDNYPIVAKKTIEQYRDRAIRLGLGSKMQSARSAKREAAGKPALKAVGKGA